MILKNRLKSLRHKHEMNQVEFAAFLDVDKVTYNSWEKGKRSPTLLKAIMIAEKLKCNVTDIFYLE